MKVKVLFLQDVDYIKEGETKDLPKNTANELVQAGIAQYTDIPVKEVENEIETEVELTNEIESTEEIVEIKEAEVVEVQTEVEAEVKPEKEAKKK